MPMRGEEDDGTGDDGEPAGPEEGDGGDGPLVAAVEQGRLVGVLRQQLGCIGGGHTGDVAGVEENDDLGGEEISWVFVELVGKREERATLTVIAIASPSPKTMARTAHVFQARRTALDSRLSGKKRSKKKAEPKTKATNTPTKML